MQETGTVIDAAIEYVKNFFANDYSGHDYFHTLRVYKMATNIAIEENANLEIVQLAALLHDVDDIKLSRETHANKDNAVNFLRQHCVEENKIRQICQIISEISFAGKDSVIPESLEGKCVQDADRLDAMGAIGIARAFAYGGSHGRMMHHPEIKPSLDMGKEIYQSHISTTINHFYEKLLLLTDLMNTTTARMIAEKREKYMKEYISEFLDEWDGEMIYFSFQIDKGARTE